MERKRIILFAGVILSLLVVPALFTIILIGAVLPWWSYAIYGLIVFINAALYLAQRCWLIDHFFVQGRIWSYISLSMILVFLCIIMQFLPLRFSDRYQIGNGITVADFLGYGLMLSQRLALGAISIVTVLVALAVALSDEWRLAAFRYHEAERDKKALATERDTLKVQVDALKQSAPDPEFITVKVNLVMTQIPLDDILYVKSDGDYVFIHTLNGRPSMVLMTLKTLEKKLPYNRFCRIHRSYLVAIDKVQGLQGGKVIVNGQSLPLSDSCKPSFFEQLSHKSIILRTNTDTK